MRSLHLWVSQILINLPPIARIRIFSIVRLGIGTVSNLSILIWLDPSQYVSYMLGVTCYGSCAYTVGAWSRVCPISWVGLSDKDLEQNTRSVRLLSLILMLPIILGFFLLTNLELEFVLVCAACAISRILFFELFKAESVGKVELVQLALTVGVIWLLLSRLAILVFLIDDSVLVLFLAILFEPIIVLIFMWLVGASNSIKLVFIDLISLPKKIELIGAQFAAIDFLVDFSRKLFPIGLSFFPAPPNGAKYVLFLYALIESLFFILESIYKNQLIEYVNRQGVSSRLKSYFRDWVYISVIPILFSMIYIIYGSINLLAFISCFCLVLYGFIRGFYLNRLFFQLSEGVKYTTLTLCLFIVMIVGGFYILKKIAASEPSILTFSFFWLVLMLLVICIGASNYRGFKVEGN
jgi:hypothetical protein